MGTSGAGMGVESVCHFGLVFCSGVLISEDVGNLAFFAVVGAVNRSHGRMRRILHGLESHFQTSP